MSCNQVLGHRFQRAVVAVEPGGQARVINVCNVVPLCGFRAVVVNNSKQFILSLSAGVLAPRTKYRN